MPNTASGILPIAALSLEMEGCIVEKVPDSLGLLLSFKLSSFVNFLISSDNVPINITLNM